MTPALTTPRLILRLPQAGDWPFYRAYRFSPRSTLAGEDEGMAWTHFAAFFGHWTLRAFGRFIAQDRLTGDPIGHFGPFHPAGHAEGELTWTLWDASSEGQGLALEAASATRAHAFSTLGWTTAVSHIDAANTRSQALATRLGARRDETAMGPYGPAIQVWRHPVQAVA